MDEEDGEEKEIEIGEKRIEAAGEAVGEGEDEIARVVHVAAYAPPAREKQAAFSLKGVFRFVTAA